MDCVSEDLSEQTCPLIEGCETRPVWLKVRDSIVQALDSMTLADLIKDRPERRHTPSAPVATAGPNPL
jgi:DNA-binding IscR family transcriptional regulator